MDGSEIEKLIADISKLPGLGRRSAQRIALYLLKNKDRSLLPLIQTLESSHKLIIECSFCGNVDMSNPCHICSGLNRDKKSICIIEDVSDLWTFERTGFYRGLYHVLGGSLSAINGIGTEELTIKKLIKRIEENEITEVDESDNSASVGVSVDYAFGMGWVEGARQNLLAVIGIIIAMIVLPIVAYVSMKGALTGRSELFDDDHMFDDEEDYDDDDYDDDDDDY